MSMEMTRPDKCRGSQAEEEQEQTTYKHTTKNKNNTTKITYNKSYNNKKKANAER